MINFQISKFSLYHHLKLGYEAHVYVYIHTYIHTYIYIHIYIYKYIYIIL